MMPKKTKPKDTYVIIDVGCIECGEVTEVLGFYSAFVKAEAAFKVFAEKRGVDLEDWKPASAIGYFCRDREEPATELIGFGFFTGGQHSLELHLFPARVRVKGEELP